jgi:hypothetical protein
MADAGNAVPRQPQGGRGHAAIRLHTIELVFQRYPGTDATSAVQGLDYEVRVGRLARPGTTGADGKVTVRVPAGTRATVTAMGTMYELSAAMHLPAHDTIEGAQRRLNMLGYNAGFPDGSIGPKTEIAVLNYQADNAPLRVEGLLGAQTSTGIRDKVGE